MRIHNASGLVFNHVHNVRTFTEKFAFDISEEVLELDFESTADEIRSVHTGLTRKQVFVGLRPGVGTWKCHHQGWGAHARDYCHGV